MSKWIPMSKQKPPEYELVLISIWGSDFGYVFAGESIEESFAKTRERIRYVTTGYIGSDGWYGPDGYPLMMVPLAWMPMPEVYNGEEE